MLLVLLMLGGGGTALVWVPLLGLPGYELSAALAIAHGLLAACFGIAAARQERRLIQGVDPRPAGAERFDSPLRSTLSALGAGALLSLLALALPFGASVIYALSSTRCDPFAHVGFFPLLALPSAGLSVASGVLGGLRAKSWWGALLWHGLLVLASAALTVWPVVFGPQVFAFNHFAGYLPGPLYDEALTLTGALWWFRLETVLLTLLLVVLAANGLDMKRGRVVRPHLRPGSGLLLAALAYGVVQLELSAPALGTRMDDAFLSDALGGRRETDHLVLHYPRGLPREELERAVRDLEFRIDQVSTFLGEAPPGKVTVWWYRNAAEKQRLVGAEHTQFAKPWRREVHVNADGFPHPVVKHELVHALAAGYGAAPFGVTARFGGLWPLAGVIEGLAVAGDQPLDELTLHQWAAGMKQQQLLPDVRELMGNTGFYRSPPSRSYTAAGSFMLWLADTFGGQKLRALYRTGDFQGVYDQSLDALATGWEAFLGTVPLDPAATHQAFARFRRKALFARECAREVASLSREAAELLAADPDLAVDRYQRCALLQPDEPGHVLAEATALHRAGRTTDAVDLLKRLGQSVTFEPSTQAEVQMALADLSWALGKKDATRAALETVLTLEPSAPMERTARVKLAAIDASEQMSAALWAYFKPGGDDVKLLVLREALERAPAEAEASYLVGRRLAQGSQPALARHALDQALEGQLAPSIRREALRLKVESLFLSGDCAQVKQAVAVMPDFGPVFAAQTAEWAARCDFETSVFGAALVPAGVLR